MTTSAREKIHKPMNPALLSKNLRPIYDKVLGEERISDSDALELYSSRDLNGIGGIANLLRERKNGNVATYVLNRYINYSNLCVLACQFCAFGARRRDAHAFEMAIPEIIGAAQAALAHDARRAAGLARRQRAGARGHRQS